MLIATRGVHDGRGPVFNERIDIAQPIAARARVAGKQPDQLARFHVIHADVKTKSPGPDLAGHVGKVYGVSFSPDGQFLASSGDDATVRVWNMTTMQPARITVALPQDQSATFSEAGQLLSDPEEAGDALVYVVQRESGALELLTPAEFPARASAKAAASDSE